MSTAGKCQSAYLGIVRSDERGPRELNHNSWAESNLPDTRVRVEGPDGTAGTAPNDNPLF